MLLPGGQAPKQSDHIAARAGPADALEKRESDGKDAQEAHADLRGAVRLVRETGKPIVQVAQEPGSTRACWVTGLALGAGIPACTSA